MIPLSLSSLSLSPMNISPSLSDEYLSLSERMRHAFDYLPCRSRYRPIRNEGPLRNGARRRRVSRRGMGPDMVTIYPPLSPLHERTSVMRARAHNAERFHMYMAASLRVDEADPHLHVVMHNTDSGIAYYLMESGDVLAFPMTAFQEVRMHAPHLNPHNNPFIDRDIQ